MEYMQMREMAQYSGISYRSLKNYKRMDPNFPMAIHITSKLIVYRKEDVDKYIAHRNSSHARKKA